MHDLSFELLILTRILAAVLFGFGLGLERELTNKYAGLRTHILVCLGACTFTILSIYGFPNFSGQGQPYGDHARVAAQIITGIGFIGGGTVLRHGSSVYGLTTAATLWLAASIGMACGTGMIDIGFVTTILSVGVLVLIRLFERNVLIHSTKNAKRLKITVTCKDEDAEEIHNHIIENFGHMHEISRGRSEKKENLTDIIAIIDVSSRRPIQSLYKSFEELNGIESVSIQEDNE